MPESNHTCRNSNCQKAYYACGDCDKVNSWRASYCSVECYQEVMKIYFEESIDSDK